MRLLRCLLVAVLGLISLFTHMHIFWIAGLLLALVDIPDIGGALGRIARSTEKMADIQPDEDTVETEHLPRSATDGGKDGATIAPARAETVPASRKEMSHA